MGGWRNWNWCETLANLLVTKDKLSMDFMTERTFSIIKPDAVKRHLIGAILGRFESQGFRVVALKMVQLTKEQAEGFYAEHQR